MPPNEAGHDGLTQKEPSGSDILIVLFQEPAIQEQALMQSEIVVHTGSPKKLYGILILSVRSPPKEIILNVIGMSIPGFFSKSFKKSIIFNPVLQFPVFQESGRFYQKIHIKQIQGSTKNTFVLDSWIFLNSLEKKGKLFKEEIN